MAAFTAPEDEAGRRHLLLEASSAFSQMADIARQNSFDADDKVFYSHLAFNCARIHYLLEASTHLDGGVIDQILGHLGSLIPEGGIQELPYTYSAAARLRMLKIHWTEVRVLRNAEQRDFISRWLRPNASVEKREALDRALEDCVDEISKRQPIQQSKGFGMELTVKSLGEPQAAIRTAAQSTFDALHSCKKCICPGPHDFGVKLELGTYRQPPKISRARLRQYRYQDRTAGGLEFEVFLSMEKNWHEVGIHSVGTRVGFSLPREEHLTNRRKATSARNRIEILCEEITRMKSKRGQRLELELTEDQLFDMGFEKTSFNIGDSAEDISLIQCIKEHRESFTERTKRILYLIIGYTVLHLHNTSWLQPEWGSADIKFFQTSSSEIPLRPFIETRLDEKKGDHGDDRDDQDAFYHPCPVLVSLAVVLLEVYFVKPFSVLAMEQSVVLIDDPRGRVAVTDLDQVYYGVEEAGCRCHIPEDSKGLLLAIENCIDGELWEDSEGNILDHKHLKSRIYQNVVQPLEAHLSHGFSQIPLDSIDQHARTIDFAHRGSFITCKRPDEWPGLVSAGILTPARALSLTPIPHASGPTIQLRGYLTEVDCCLQLAQDHPVAHSTSDLDPKTNSDAGNKCDNFFDDEIGDKKK